MSEMVERVAKALAGSHGDKWDDLPRDKSHWTEMRGQFGGRFRDVNEPYRCDYVEGARAAIEAMREPTGEMVNAAQMQDGAATARYNWCDMIDVALNA